MSTPKPFEFEKALKELEDITTWFESADVDLDEGLTKFEHGMRLVSQLKEHLAGVENRVEKIKQHFDGTPHDTTNTTTIAPDPDAGTANNHPADPLDDPSQGGLF